MFEFKIEFEYGERLYEVPKSSDFEGTIVNVDVVEVELTLVKGITKL